MSCSARATSDRVIRENEVQNAPASGWGNDFAVSGTNRLVSITGNVEEERGK